MTSAIAIIGCGHLGEAIARGLLASGHPKGSLVASHPREARRREIEGFGVRATSSNAEAARSAEVVIVAVKPQMLGDVLPGIADATRGKLVVSLAAGTPLETIAKALPGARVVRAMPNTPAEIRAAATGLFAGSDVSEADRATITSIFDSIGKSFWVAREDLFHAITALSACGPAFVFVVAEALADGGVAAGLPRALALALAAQTVAGSGGMLAQGTHPAELKDAVASAGGTTVHGLAALERAGVRGGVIAAVIAAAERSRAMARGEPPPSSKAIEKGLGARNGAPKKARRKS